MSSSDTFNSFKGCIVRTVMPVWILALTPTWPLKHQDSIPPFRTQLQASISSAFVLELLLFFIRQTASEMPIPMNAIAGLNWATTDINQEDALGPVNWQGLLQYAIDIKSQRDGSTTSTISCQLSPEYNKGGRNLVRRLVFQDGTCWVVRIQLEQHSSDAAECLRCEVHTINTVRERSTIPVPEVYAYESTHDNVAMVPFILMEFIPGNTAMDSFGGYEAHGGEIPPLFKPKFHAAMADIQVQMSAIRFPKIGAITKSPDGTYTVGPIPGIGGPFESAAQFFDTWAEKARFPYRDEVIRERTPPQVVDEILKSIATFPPRLKELAKNYCFHKGPFPLFHTDFYNSNMIIDSQHNVLSVIDWEDAFVAPWEMVEFTKELSIVPPAMDGLAYSENEQTRQMLLERSQYIKLAREIEAARGLDNRFSSVLEDSNGQDFAHALWLYLDGRIGFYGAILDKLVHIDV